jgi:organic radical activating enzyme
MKSLQVVTPHIKCIFNCPFCIAKGHKHDNSFINNYEDNYNLWKNNLIRTIKKNSDLKYIVITGTNEPMQSKKCVSDIIDIVRNTNKDIQIELQTRYYKQDDIYNKLDVVAYSISDITMLNRIKPLGKIVRYVIILTNSFNNCSLNDILKLIPKNVKQLTFKKLVLTNGVNQEVDEYIINNSVDLDTLDRLKRDVELYDGDLSIRMDLNCMDCEGRYKIFREDGYVYDNWDSC